MNGISKLLSTDGFIQVNKALIKKIGLHESILIGELCAEYNYWEEHGKLDKDGMFYSSRSNIEDNTGLSEHQQRKAMANLKELGILEIDKRGIPAVNHYKIVFDKILNILNSSGSKIEALEVENLNSNNNKQTTINKQTKDLSKDKSTDFSFGKKQTKPKKENLFSKCVSQIDNFTSDTELRNTLVDYLRVRLEMKDKPLYANSWKGLLNKLDREFDASERLAVVRQSIERGYASFFPVSNGYSRNRDMRQAENMNYSVPHMTEEDYAEEEKLRAELEKKGVRTVF